MSAARLRGTGIPGACWRFLAAALLLSGCSGGGSGGGFQGGGGDGGTNPPPKTIDRVTVSPGSALVLPGETFQFTAEVEGSEPDHRVTWSLASPSPGEAALGTISPNGLYTAPEFVPNRTIVVVATSLADPRRAGSATVTMQYAVEVTPPETSVARGGTVQFRATVRGSADQSVVWRADYGRIDATGIYTAPVEQWIGSDRVTAQAPQAGYASASALIHLLSTPPVLTSSSGAATAGEVLTVLGSGFVADTAIVFPAADGGELVVPATVVSPTEVRAKVPMGAASGPIVAELHAGGSPAVRSNALPFERIPRLRLSAAQRDVAAGESVAISVAFLGGDPAPLTWSADRGTVEGGVFTAPASMTADGFARVTACVADTASCATVLLGLRQFRIEPAAPVVAAGQSIALTAVGAAGPLAATWQVIEGNGTFQGSRFIASASLRDASRTRVVAHVGDAVEEAEVAVTGLAPGLVQRVNDHVDFHDAVPLGTYAEQVVVSGSRAYALATDRLEMWGSRDYLWIDVYDVSDPVHPAWLGAVESLTHPDALVVVGDHLAGISRSDWAAGSAASVALYDLNGPLPRPVGHAAWDPTVTGTWNTWTWDGRWLYAVDEGYSSIREILSLRVYDAASGSAAPVAHLDLGLPRRSYLTRLLASEGRLFVGLRDASPGPMTPSIAVFDLTADPPTFVGEVAGSDAPTQVIGSYLYAYPNLYEVSGALPVLVGPLPVPRVIEAPDGRAVEQRYYDVSIVDVSRPWAPQRVGSMVASGSFAWAGTWLLSAEGAGGLAVYDVAPPGGPLGRGAVAGGICYTLVGNDLAADGRYLYVAGLTECGDLPPIPYGELAVYDLSTSPPAYVGSAVDYHNAALSVQLVGTGTLAFVGHARGLSLYDVSSPAEPTPIATTPLDGAVLALRENVLFAATSQGRLAVLDVTQPSVPVELGSAPIDGTPLRARLAGDLLLVALGPDGLAIYDVSFPEAPLLLSQIKVGSPIADALVVEDVALAASGEAGLLSIDIRDPTRPAPVGAVLLEPALDRFWPRYPRPAAAGLTLRDGLLYVGSNESGWGILHAFDVRDPRRPALASLSFSGNAVAFAWNGADLFATGAGAAAQVDMTRPRNVIALGPPAAALVP